MDYSKILDKLKEEYPDAVEEVEALEVAIDDGMADEEMDMDMDMDMEEELPELDDMEDMPDLEEDPFADEEDEEDDEELDY